MFCHWGILGPGFVATRALIPALQHVPNARVVAVASRGPQRAASVAAQFGIAQAYSDYQALLDNPNVDAVYIALPNALHHPWTLRAAQAGKHVLCEKPLALSVAECDEMIAACQQANVFLMEAVMYRFHPRMIALQDMLARGEVGELRLLHAAFSFPFQAPENYRASPHLGGGALLDIGSYCVNAARWLIGTEPQVVQAITSYSQEIDRTTSAILHFERPSERLGETGQSVLAHIQCSFAAAEHQVIEVVGSRGAVTAPLAFTAWRDDRTILLVQRESIIEQREFAPADPYQAMAAHFTDAVLGNTSLLYPPTDGRATLAVLEKIRSLPIDESPRKS